MEYVGGGSALDMLKPGPIEEEFIAIILRDILKGLDYLHAERKLHRDIKGWRRESDPIKQTKVTVLYNGTSLSETRTSFRWMLFSEVRLRRHEMSFGNISETVRDSNFKIYRNVSLFSLCSLTGNDVIICFRSAANRINVFILPWWSWVVFGSRCLDNGSIDFKKVYSLGTSDSSAQLALMKYLGQFCSFTPKMPLRWNSPRLRITLMADVSHCPTNWWVFLFLTILSIMSL